MESLFSKMVKSGKVTYFLDVREAKNNSKYLSLTASQPSPTDPGKFTKRSIVVFGNVADELVGAFNEARQVKDGDPVFSRTLKSGRTTYCLDAKKAKNNSQYVSISSTQPTKEDPTKYSKKSIAVFENAAEEFADAMQDMVSHLKE